MGKKRRFSKGHGKSSKKAKYDGGPLLDISTFTGGVQDLEKEGMAKVTRALQESGLKCGGSIHDRAERLFMLKSTAISEIHGKHLAKGVKKNVEWATKLMKGDEPKLKLVQGRIVLVCRESEGAEVYSGVNKSKDGSPAVVGVVGASGDVELSPETLAEPTKQQSKNESNKNKKTDNSNEDEEDGEGSDDSGDESSDDSADGTGNTGAVEAAGSIHPFETDDDDHCETSIDAYRDISGLLEKLGTLLGKPKSDLRIYDPYYCNGGVVRNLASLGFPHVYNKNEDFYEVVNKEREPPEYDILVTNPPYSGDHMEKLLRFCTGSGKPWLLLMPNYVYAKDYYKNIMKGPNTRVFFFVPSKRYTYWTPKNLLRKKHTHTSALGERTSPFVTFWYCNASGYRQEIEKWWKKKPRKGVVYASSVQHLPIGVMDDSAKEEYHANGGRRPGSGNRHNAHATQQQPRQPY